MNRYSQSLLFSAFLVVIHLATLALGYFYFQPQLLILSYLCFFLFKGIGSEIGAHRFFTHQSFQTNRFFRYLFIFLQTWSGEGSILAFAGVHRTHHQNSDSQEDPHPPTKNWLAVWFWMRIPHFELMLIRDLLKDKWLIRQHRFYYPAHLSAFAILMWIDPALYLHIIAIPVVLTCSANAMINIFCHGFGYRNFETKDHSTNNTWVNLWTLGTGLHNNHHAFPKSFDNRRKSGEMDFLAVLIKSVFKI